MKEALENLAKGQNLGWEIFQLEDDQTGKRTKPV
jgi:hypothetical protein